MAYVFDWWLYQENSRFLFNFRSAFVPVGYDGLERVRQTSWKVATDHCRRRRQRVSERLLRDSTREIRNCKKAASAGQGTLRFGLRTSVRYDKHRADP